MTTTTRRTRPSDFTSTGRWMSKCANGHVTFAPVGPTKLESGLYLACACGSRGFAKVLSAYVSDSKVCDARCTGATGPDCECSCGGRGHGSDHSLDAADL